MCTVLHLRLGILPIQPPPGIKRVAKVFTKTGLGIRNPQDQARIHIICESMDDESTTDPWCSQGAFNHWGVVSPEVYLNLFWRNKGFGSRWIWYEKR